MGVALLLCGCPKRQTSSRVVYVAAPPAVAKTTSGESGGEMVIEEPPPPEPPETPVETTPQEPTTLKTPVKPRRRVITPTETSVETQSPETTEPTVTAPALEPRESPQQQTALRLRVMQSQESVQARINALGRTSLGNVDRKTLEDARMFLNQSRKALEGADLQRANNLARKASLLVDALEQKP
jgi:hypothetical protein